MDAKTCHVTQFDLLVCFFVDKSFYSSMFSNISEIKEFCPVIKLTFVLDHFFYLADTMKKKNNEFCLFVSK